MFIKYSFIIIQFPENIHPTFLHCDAILEVMNNQAAAQHNNRRTQSRPMGVQKLLPFLQITVTASEIAMW